MSTPTVDVIVPCRNRAVYVRLAVASVLAQTSQASSIIVVDDGLTDDIPGALTGLAGPVTVIRIDQSGGAASARNAGIEASSGDLIAFLDDDDLWCPTKLERQVAYMREHPACVLVHTGFIKIDGEGRELAPRGLRKPLEGQCLPSLLRGSNIVTASVMVPRTALGPLRFHAALRNAEDWDLWLRLAAQGPFGYVAEPLVRYRVHPSNKSANQERMDAARAVIMDRVLAREQDLEVRQIAKAERRLALTHLAHAAFEAGRLAEARSRFISLLPGLGFPEWRRLAASLLPRSLSLPLTRWWRGRADTN